MTSEQPPRDALRPLRPLPSIDVPLLRSERSAFRSKLALRWLILASGLAGIGTAGVLAYQASQTDRAAAPREEPKVEQSALSRSDVKPAESEGVDERHRIPAPPTLATVGRATPPSAAPAEDSAPTPQPLPIGATSLQANAWMFGKALSFRDALEKNGISRDDTNALIAALNGVLDFRRSHPEDTLSVERAIDGSLTRFEYRASLTQRYEVTRDASGKLKGRQIDVPVRTVRVAKGGIVSGSLGDTLDGLKLGRTMAGVFSEVFDGRVNFSTDTRTGDSFRIVFDEEYVEGTFLRFGVVQAIEYKGEKAGLLRAFWHGSASEGDFYDEHGRALHGGWLRTPLRYDHVSSGYGMRFHPVLKRKKLHNGIDYAAPSGTQVRAAADGTVTFAGNKGPNGNLLSVTHAQGYESYYAHLLRFAPGIKAGAKVKQRQLVAYVGTTGRSTGPHLHFSLKRRGAFVDPNSQLNGPGLPMSAHDLIEYKRRVKEMTAALTRIKPERPLPLAPPPSALGPSADEAATDFSDEEL